MIMPWGKHKGEDIEDIDSGYSRWLAANCEDDMIATLADDEFNARDDKGMHIWEDSNG